MFTVRRKNIKIRKRPSQKRSTESVERILKHAARILEEVGVEDFSTNEISRQSGVTIGSIYHYFPNKEAIIHELCVRWLENITYSYESFEELELDGEDSEAFWANLVDCIFRGYKETPAIHAVTRATAIWPNIRELDVQYDETAMLRIEKYLEQNGVNVSVRERRRLSVLGLNLLHHGIMLALSMKGNDPRRTLADLVSFLVGITERYK